MNSNYDVVNYDVIVAGGGIIGSAVAYYVAKKGQRVLVVEREDQASGTAGATDGAVAYHTKKPGFSMDLAVQSISMFSGLSEELGMDIEYHESRGGMLVIEDEQQWELMEQLAKEQSVSGVDVRVIGIDKARELEPQLSPKLLGALYSPTGGSVHPMLMTFAFASAAKRLGADFKNETEVTGIIKKDGAVKGVNTTAGDFFSEKLVIAAGAWSAALGEMAGFAIPIKPRKGQLLVTEPVGPFIKNGSIQCARYFVVKNRPETVTDEYVLRTGASLAIEQTDDGAILIGSTRELVGFDGENTLESFEAITQRAVTFFPALRDVHVIRSFSGFRPYTPDGMPMIGKVDSVDGLYIAAGHEGDGIALAPITGKLLAEEIVDGKASFSLEPVSPNRFN